MSQDHLKHARDAERYVVRIIDEFTSHLTASNDNIAELRRRLEIETSAALRKAYDAGYGDGYEAGVDYSDRHPYGPDGQRTDTPVSKGTIVPYHGSTGLRQNDPSV